MAYSSTSRKQGQRGCCPFPLHPKSPPTRPPLRCGRSRLTIPNTYSTITMSASLRSDCCSPSLRNAVRLPTGIDVHLHRNTQLLPSWPLSASRPVVCSTPHCLKRQQLITILYPNKRLLGFLVSVFHENHGDVFCCAISHEGSRAAPDFARYRRK